MSTADQEDDHKTDKEGDTMEPENTSLWRRERAFSTHADFSSNSGDDQMQFEMITIIEKLIPEPGTEE